jgi:hypothetical protein
MQQPILLKKLISLLLLLPLTAAAQDLTGLWKGTLYNDTTRETLRFEIGISQEKGKLTGYSHTFIQHKDRLYFAIKKIKVKQKGSKIILEDVGLLHNSSPLEPPKGVNKTCVLDLDMMDSLMVLSGPFATNRTKEYHVLTGKVYLQRKNDYYQSDLLGRLKELRLANANNFEPLAYLEKAAAPGGINASTAPALAVNNSKPTMAPAETPTVVTTVTDIKSETIEPVASGPELVKINGSASPTQMAPVKTAPAPATIVGKKSVAVDSFPLPVTANELNLTKIDNALAVQTASTQGAAPVPATMAGKKSVAVDSFPLPVTSNEPQLTKIDNALAVQTASTQGAAPVPATMAGSKGVAVTVGKPQLPSGPALELENRQTETVETVAIESDSLQLTLYDNGEVDGDTVSVLLNGQLIMPKQGLSTRAVKKTVYLSPGTETVQLVMYAESLGSIPPNTGLLVVHDGEKIYEIRFSADMKKNAAIVFKRKR